MTETWKDIPGYEGLYQASDCGNIRNGRGRLIALCNGSGGYKVASLGKNNSCLVHRLVALSFIGAPTQEKPLVLHANGDRSDNRLANLRYGDYFDNSADAIKHGTQVRGERQHVAKLTYEQVKHIKTSDESTSHLAKKYNVTRQCIYLIRKNKNWAHV